MQIVLNYGKDIRALVKRSSDIPEDMVVLSTMDPCAKKKQRLEFTSVSST